MAKDTQSKSSALGGSIKTETTETGLRITDLVIGDGAEAIKGKNVSVKYRGTLENGQEFDSNYGKAPFTFLFFRSVRLSQKPLRRFFIRQARH